ncbi:proclotting enzyme-like isoform X2 [Tachypleus tridentatus]|uniref:proclotting enzyme-like isoform X2 n=1 Tax=Tachypleus tridentatus TaxID=6853 RepID=UPI003FD2AE8E
MEVVSVIWWCVFYLFLHLLNGGSLIEANIRWKRQGLVFQTERSTLKADVIGECRTHENKEGSCRDVTMCEVLQGEIQGGVKPNICEWKGITPIVCCPLPLTTTTVTTTTTESLAQDRSLVFPTERSTLKADVIGECRTHENKEGSCRDVTMCEVLQAEIQGGVKPNICEWKGITPIVCCPLPLTTTTVTATTTESLAQDRRCARVSTKISAEEFRTQDSKPKPAKGKPWPWMAAIFIEKSGKKQFLCGGTLIDHRLVVSAAHCFIGIVNPKIYTVRLSELNLNNDNDGSISQYFQVKGIRVHAQYIEGMNYNDIALLYLEKPVNYTKFIQPACLLAEETVGKSLTGKDVIVTGWGQEYGGTVLQEGKILVISNTACENAYEGSRDYNNKLPQGLTDDFLCAGTLGNESLDACQGDSGGPLLMTTNDGYWTLVGIVSVRAQCGVHSFPGVYTRVSAFLQWIYISVFTLT